MTAATKAKPWKLDDLLRKLYRCALVTTREPHDEWHELFYDVHEMEQRHHHGVCPIDHLYRIQLAWRTQREAYDAILEAINDPDSGMRAVPLPRQGKR